MNTPDLAASLARAAGIPSSLLPSVEERARKAERAVLQVDGFRPLGKGAEVLARRIADRAVDDHAKGLLERRVGP